LDERPEKARGVTTDIPGALVFIDEAHSRFSDSYQHETIESVWTLRNTGEGPVLIEQALAVRGEGVLTVDPALVPAGGLTRVALRQPLAESLGETGFRYALITDEPGVSRYRFSISGFVQSAFDPERPALDFGRIDRSRGATVRTELFSREVARLELGEAAGELPSELSLAFERAGIAGEGLVLVGTLAPGAPLGIASGSFELRTNVPKQPRLVVSYRAEVFGDVVPSKHPVDFGLVYTGQETVKELELRSRSGTAFRVEGIDDDVGLLGIEFAPCSGNEPDSCYAVRLRTVVPEPRPFGGILKLRLEGDPEPIPLSYGGFVVPEGVEIRKINMGEDDAGAEADQRETE
jgi:hypothetical protein